MGDVSGKEVGVCTCPSRAEFDIPKPERARVFDIVYMFREVTMMPFTRSPTCTSSTEFECEPVGCEDCGVRDAMRGRGDVWLNVDAGVGCAFLYRNSEVKFIYL